MTRFASSTAAMLAALAVLCPGLLVPAPSSAFDSRGWGMLEDGRLGDYRWSVQARQEGGPAGAASGRGRPACLMVGVKREYGPFSFSRVRFRTCADGPRRLDASSKPLIATSSMARDGRPALTAVGVIAAPRVSRLRITLSNGQVGTIGLDPLSRAQAARTGLGRARYAALSVRGVWSAVQVLALSASGRVLWDSEAAAPVIP